MTLIAYDPDLIEAIAARLRLREPNRLALHAIARSLDDATEVGIEIVCDLATGTGKSYIAAGLVEYLAATGHNNVLIMCHRTAILNKTRRNFTPGDRKYVDGLDTRPEIVTVDTFRQQRLDPEQPTLYLFNVQQLLRPGAEMRRQTRNFDETLGQSLFEHMKELDDLVVIADEHHMYFGPEFSRPARELNPLAIIGLTATPHPDTPPQSIIYRYSLAEAIADEYVKIPVLVGRHDGAADLNRVLADGVRLLDTKQQAINNWCARPETTHQAFNAVMFVVCETITEAEQVGELLAGADYIGDPDAVLTINSNSQEEALDRLDQIEEPDSKVRAVVSVMMLQEGWDVRNIYVIATTRALESKALSEQILGRGLRLPFGDRTHQQMLDTVEVLSHRRFREILANAEAMLQVFFNQQTGLVASGADSTVPAGAAPQTDRGRFDAIVTATNSDGTTGESTAFGFELVDTGTRIQELDDQTFRFTQTMGLRPGAPRFKFPRLKSTLRPAVFNLSDFVTADAENLGRGFTEEIAATLKRELLDVERTDDGTRVAARAAEGTIEATQLTFGMDDLRTKIQTRVLDSRYVERTRSQINALNRIIESFLNGAGADDNAQWGQARVHAAVERVLGYIQTLYRNRPTGLIEEVELVDYPRLGAPLPAEVHNKATLFVPHRWYDGWNRNVLPVARFDAKSTEFALAEILETDNMITWWCRIETHQEVAIAYEGGGNYYPDFLAVDVDGTHWVIEGKADSKALDPDVVAKKQAAERWARYVNDSGDAPDPWRYMFATESAIRGAAGSFAALITATNPV